MWVLKIIFYERHFEWLFISIRRILKKLWSILAFFFLFFDPPDNWFSLKVLPSPILRKRIKCPNSTFGWLTPECGQMKRNKEIFDRAPSTTPALERGITLTSTICAHKTSSTLKKRLIRARASEEWGTCLIGEPTLTEVRRKKKGDND